MQNITTRGIIRLVIYVLGALAGLAAAILPALGIGDYTALLTAIAGAAAVITGGTAAYNIERAPDQHRDLDLGALLPSIIAIVREGIAVGKAQADTVPPAAPVEPEPEPVTVPSQPGNMLIEQLRDMIAQNTRRD